MSRISKGGALAQPLHSPHIALGSHRDVQCPLLTRFAPRNQALRGGRARVTRKGAPPRSPGPCARTFRWLIDTGALPNHWHLNTTVNANRTPKNNPRDTHEAVQSTRSRAQGGAESIRRG